MDVAGDDERGRPNLARVVVDGIPTQVAMGVTLLEACDAAGVYVPRLCYLPGRRCCSSEGMLDIECGLCVVRREDGATVLGCSTTVTGDLSVRTDDADLRALRRERLAAVLAEHPHVCLSCPDREGCSRDECTYGNAPEARCCDKFGRCELGRLVEYLDPGLEVPRRAVCVDRTAEQEGRIRREPGLCVGCGRCVRLCATAPQAGRALGLAPRPAGGVAPARGAEGARGRPVALPTRGTLRGSGCTFCGLCVMVCPTGALTTPGEGGSRWLADQRAKHGPPTPVLPPDARHMRIPDEMHLVPEGPGLVTLFDAGGRVVRIAGVADMLTGLANVLAEPGGQQAVGFRCEPEPLYTQRETEALARFVHEHGRLPEGNDLGHDLFDDDAI